MSQDFVRSLAIEQRRRLVASLMEHFEKRVVPTLPTHVRGEALRDYRNKVMQSVGVYHDMVLDCLKAATNVSDGETIVVNAEAMRMLEQVHRATVGHGR